MRGHARLWLLRRSPALEISSAIEETIEIAQVTIRYILYSAAPRRIDNSVAPNLSMAHSSRRNVEGGNRRTEVKEDERIGRQEGGTRRTRIGGTNGREGSRCVYERRTTFCGALLSWPVGPSFVYSACASFGSSSLRQPLVPPPLFPGSPLNTLARLWPRFFYSSRFQSAQTGFKIPPAEKSECLLLSHLRFYMTSLLIFLLFLLLLLLLSDAPLNAASPCVGQLFIAIHHLSSLHLCSFSCK